MAAPVNTPSTGDIWHLSIDDLLAPLPDKTCLGGAGPFVINLSASTAPIDVPTGTFAGCEETHVYQVHRMEDRRPRYRLRLGPFDKEERADAALRKVRDVYPGALTATADGDDLRAIAALRAKAHPHPAPAPAVIQPAAPPPTVMKPVPPPTIVAKSAPPPTVAKLVPPPTIVAKSAPPSPAMPPAQVPVLTSALKVGRGVPDLETTQTVRVLTTMELEDEEASRWFVIQLSSAEQAFDPDTVPNLDIFSVYRLYSVAGIDQGRIVHVLRLGFFSAEIAASAVASYLSAFYDQPTIKRVSAAERDRFAEQSLEPRKDVGATGKQAVIEITDERYVRERRIGRAAGK